MRDAHAFDVGVRTGRMHPAGDGGLTWRKSRRSGYQGNCVELARASDEVGMRNSRAPEGAVLWFEVATMVSFLAAIKTGALDDLI